MHKTTIIKSKPNDDSNMTGNNPVTNAHSKSNNDENRRMYDQILFEPLSDDNNNNNNNNDCDDDRAVDNNNNIRLTN